MPASSARIGTMANETVQQQDRVKTLLARENHQANDEYSIEWAITGHNPRGIEFDAPLEAVAQAIANARREGYLAGLTAGGTRLQPGDVLPDPKIPERVDQLPDFWDQRRESLGKPDKSQCALEL